MKSVQCSSNIALNFGTSMRKSAMIDVINTKPCRLSHIHEAKSKEGENGRYDVESENHHNYNFKLIVRSLHFIKNIRK